MPDLFLTAYLPAAVAPDIIEENNRNLREQLASLRLYDIDVNRPTNAAVLLFGKEPLRWIPGAWVQFVRWAGDTMATDVVEQKQLSGDLINVLRALDSFVAALIRSRPVTDSALRERIDLDYPTVAMRELLLNAIMHRSYESNAPVYFHWFADRIEIQSPGGLYGMASPENFPTRTDYRNPVVSEAMATLGYVNRFGRGVIRAQEALRQNGNPAADLDPQANLTTMFLDEERVMDLWPDGAHQQSILGSVSPILRGIGDITEPHVEQVTQDLGLIVGDLGLSRFEAKLSAAWPDCLNRDEAAFRAESAFHRTIARAVDQRGADVVLIDVGPNLGAINRAAIIAANYVVFPLAPDLFSLQGLRNIGPTLRDWREQWQDRLDRWPTNRELALPAADIEPAGYVVMQHAVRAARPVHAYQRWMRRIPGVYHNEICDDKGPSVEASVT